MIDPVERDEQQENSGMTEAYYEELDRRATEQADEMMDDAGEVAEATDYPMFMAHVTLAISATNNDERLRWLATIRDNVWERIKSQAREDLRKADLAGEEP